MSLLVTAAKLASASCVKELQWRCVYKITACNVSSRASAAICAVSEPAYASYYCFVIKQYQQLIASIITKSMSGCNLVVSNVSCMC